uniref:Sperm-tail PG-rich repeat containing 4 n=1 Tax=Ornithorhynchus anatinus TaxID=9258 RepID=A0A6I8P0D3_ORNAN
MWVRSGWGNDTPSPGFYPIRDFLQESLLNPVRPTYGFKGEGRKRASILEWRDPNLPDTPRFMPPDFLELLSKQKATYSFKNTPRKSSQTLTYKDKVCAYTYFSASPREGPGPGYYNLKEEKCQPLTSCFQSKVPRFLPICSKTPGPGTYSPTRQMPKQPRTIAKMGREHNIFFNNTFDF